MRTRLYYSFFIRSSPKYYEEVLGKQVNRDVKFGTPLRWTFVEN